MFKRMIEHPYKVNNKPAKFKRRHSNYSQYTAHRLMKAGKDE